MPSDKKSTQDIILDVNNASVRIQDLKITKKVMKSLLDALREKD